MRTKYFDLIDQTFDFPQDEFNLREDRLIYKVKIFRSHSTLLIRDGLEGLS